MFGRNTKKKLAELNDRITTLFEMTEADHSDLQDLKAHVEATNVVNQEVVDKIAELESRQHNLREGLVRLAALDGPSTPDFIENPELDT